MPSITVKNIPDTIYEKLKQQAELHHRSVNSEIIACLEKTVQSNQVSSEDILYQARQMRKQVKGSIPAEDIEKAVQSGRP